MGVALLAIAVSAWWALVSLIVITVLLLRVSGVALLERTIVERRPAYRDYLESTNAFFPGRPRSLPRSIPVVLAVVLALPLDAAMVQTWDFKAFVGDRAIGRHTFTVAREGDTVEVTSEADFEVKLLFVTAFSYAHEARERYRGDCLAEIRSKTRTRGRSFEVDGRRDGQSFVVRTQDRVDRLPECLMTFAYWTPAMLQQSRLLNSQTGEYVDVQIESVGQVAYAGFEAAQQYRLRAAKLDITVWYDDHDRWLGLESISPDGKRLRYELIEALR